ncbi:MAG: hypothetical protein CMP91_12510 [Gammaproteobacteria bacterium]|nr:hypothetical protein [Gammaproteobacteria bacterium]|tara:strand:- start:3952 stop:4548 length:597 start_codon:yes stop_codon:yes gene_type:complete
MNDNKKPFEEYFNHLNNRSFIGKIYHRLYKLPLIYYLARFYGSRILEIGSGIGNGILGAYPSKIIGIDINPIAVDFCKHQGLKAELIKEDGNYPFNDNSFDVCVLDNVLEHIENPTQTLDECSRVLNNYGLLIIIVPGAAGFRYDPDHKIFYQIENLESLDPRWEMVLAFSLPFFLKSKKLSDKMKQYCLMAVYKRKK